MSLVSINDLVTIYNGLYIINNPKVIIAAVQCSCNRVMIRVSPEAERKE